MMRGLLHRKLMNDHEYLNLLTYEKLSGSISIEPHPEEILDVDPEIIANMKARLRSSDYSNIYDISDRTMDEIALKHEKEKLQRVFKTPDQIREAFSSIQNIRVIRQELAFEDVNRRLLSDYAYILSNGENVDEVDFYQLFLFGHKLIKKEDRICKYYHQNISTRDFDSLIESYKEKHFDILEITYECIHLNSNLSQLFKEQKIAYLFNRLLEDFYGLME